jgi:hypothetical protein
MRNDLKRNPALLLGLLLAIPLFAHHSITAEFDTSKSFTVIGTLTKLRVCNFAAIP